jgi:thiosulfate/3-mercaptopyruvate sulfurtransferase
MRRSLLLPLFALLVLTIGVGVCSATSVDGVEVIQPEELVKMLHASGQKPLILNVGPRLLYAQAHIPGAEYVGAASELTGIEHLRARVKSLPRNQFIVLYCGCCPWQHCPNVRPAFKEMRALGFTRVQVLYISNNFGADWVDKGYPVTRSQ